MTEFINTWGDRIAMPAFAVTAAVLWVLAGWWDSRKERAAAAAVADEVSYDTCYKCGRGLNRDGMHTHSRRWSCMGEDEGW